MVIEVAVRYIHFLGIIVLGAALLGQLLFTRASMARREIEKLSQLDKIYAVAVIVVLAAGLYLWLGIGKPAEFYSKNPVFQTKLMLFLVIGLISIYPTLFFNKARKGESLEIVRVPALVRWSVRIEIVLLVLLPLLASFMARGIGLAS